MKRSELNKLRELAKCEAQLRDQGTLLGFGWTLVNPLVNWLVLYAVFSPWARTMEPGYSLYLLIGLMYWSYFAQVTTSLLTVFERRRFLALNVALPASTLFLSSFLSVFRPFIVENVVLAALLAALGRLSIDVLWAAPLAILLLSALGLLSGFLLAILNTFIRDAAHLWALVLRIGFFVTPVFLPREFIFGRAGWNILSLNPIAACLDIARRMDSSAALVSGTTLLSIALSLAALLAIVPPLFRRYHSRLLEAI